MAGFYATVRVTLTLDRDIELDPNTQYTAEITSITTNDTDDDTVVTVLAAFTGDKTVATPVASNHLTVTASGNQLTIAVIVASYTSAYDPDDELSFVFDRATIAVRESGSTGPYKTLNNLTWDNGGWNTGTVSVTYITVLE